MDDIATLGLLDDKAITLDTAALRIAAADHPGVDLDPYVHILGAVAERAMELGGDATTAPERAAVLAEAIGGDFGFRGDRERYDDPDNADMVRVLERRLGLPVSLSILYVAAARRLGWPADVLGTPGHVLARIGTELEPVLIDPFDRGAVVGPDRLQALLAGVLGPGAAPHPDHLAPMTNRATLVRLLMNQATRAEANGLTARARTVFERITAIAPANAHGWWDRARLELAGGDVPAARQSLSAMLEVSREPALRAHVCAALDALAGAGR